MLELNVQKIDSELARLGRNRSWLASQIGWTRQRLSDNILKKRITAADEIAHALMINAKDLLIENSHTAE